MEVTVGGVAGRVAERVSNTSKHIEISQAQSSTGANHHAERTEPLHYPPPFLATKATRRVHAKIEIKLSPEGKADHSCLSSQPREFFQPKWESETVDGMEMV